MANKKVLTGMAILVMVSLLLACDTTPTPPAPNQQQNTPTPLPPPRSAEDMIARAKQVFAEETAQNYVIAETDTITISVVDKSGTPTSDPLLQQQIADKFWSQPPDHWRLDTTMTYTVPTSPTNSYTTQSSTDALGSDGVSQWEYRSPFEYSRSAAGTIKDPRIGRINEGVANSTYELMANIVSCYTARLLDDAVIAGRAAYVIELTPMCTAQNILQDQTLRIVWLDQQSYLLLKDEIHHPHGEIVSREVTSLSVSFHQSIEAAIFASFAGDTSSGVQMAINHAEDTLAASNIQSYVMTQTSSARTVLEQINGVNMTMVVTGEQQLHTITTIWYQRPDRWRIETIKTRYADANDEDSWPPVQVSDGTNLWSYDPQAKVASKHSLTFPIGVNRIQYSDIIKHSYTQLQELNNSCYNPPILQASDTILGRAAYTIDSGGMHCPAPLLDIYMGKHTFWFDQKTGLLLKDVLYNPDDKQPLITWQVTGLQLNVPIAAAMFNFSPPAGVTIEDSIQHPTPAPYPTPHR